ncbi:hypothetical protein GGE12_001620 [Rhizobium mongolense]|uniref:Uncharacterized protein n=1 Tax=Rhizobium mongolense TaxID=57676 RepID=A0A7W6RK08_9HYPH|nr:hypothetical protein [Rhizobium mongolense]
MFCPQPAMNSLPAHDDACSCSASRKASATAGSVGLPAIGKTLLPGHSIGRGNRASIPPGELPVGPIW